MGPLDAYEAIVALGGEARFAGKVAEMRRAFEERTGAFGPNDAWFEARSRAFWDDAVTGGFAREALAELAAEVRAWVVPLERAHRGFFEVHAARGVWRGKSVEGARIVVDLWSGAEFVVRAPDDGMKDALDAAAGPVDARIVGDPSGAAAILPGAVFHPEAAAEPALRVLDEARRRKLEGRDVLDALLRMELMLRSLSRVKAGYAYRAEALPAARM
jgi:hypothetical protein